MPIFAIYEYKLSRGEFSGHFFSNNKETEENHPIFREREDYFGSFFQQKKKLIVYAPEATSKKNNYSPNYTIDVLANYDNITLLTIENNKVKHTTENKQDVEHEHHPFCHIAIDNREEHCLIAIEKSSAFDGKPERVCKIFVEGMNNEMAKDKINNSKVPTTIITYKEKLKKKEVFWDTVHEIKQLFNDSVKQIKLDFDRSKVKNNNVNPNSLMALITSMATKSNTDASVSFSSDANDEVRLDEIREDLVQMAKVCLEQKEYDLMVKFRTFGIYKFGADVKAQFGIDDSALEKFSIGEKELDEDNPDNGNFAFVKWLDRISILLKDYEDKKPILKRRTRSRRR